MNIETVEIREKATGRLVASIENIPGEEGSYSLSSGYEMILKVEGNPPVMMDETFEYMRRKKDEK